MNFSVEITENKIVTLEDLETMRNELLALFALENVGVEIEQFIKLGQIKQKITEWQYPGEFIWVQTDDGFDIELNESNPRPPRE